MAQWGNTDDAANSVQWAAAYVNKTPNTANRTALFGNTTPDAFIVGKTVGVFGVAANEVNNSNGSLVAITVTSHGSGYFANVTVTVSGNATANAHANSLGRIDALLISGAGSGYTTNPVITVGAPTAQTFNANTSLYLAQTINGNTAVSSANKFITIAANPYANGDTLLYTTAAGNTAISPLANNTTYFAVGANSSGVQLAATLGGAAISVVPTASVADTGHTFTNKSGFIQIAGNVFQNGDKVTYTVGASNTALVGLTSGNSYYVVNANSSGFRLTGIPGGAAINAAPGVSETGHTLQGQTATAVGVVTGGADKGVAHAGWVLRKVGSGGRAGRVTHETLVAMGSISTDAENIIFKG